MPETGFDLHTHTTFSDGTTTPEENAALAHGAGLAGLALTDHDTTAGWHRMKAACEARGLGFIPGIELSTELAAASIHLLGYWIDPDHPELVEECNRLRHERERRGQAIIVRLAELGVVLTWERIMVIAGGAPIGRPHIAAAMVELGVVPDLPAAFDEYLADGGPAWVPKHALDPVRGVELIRAAGGVAVLAHPGPSLDAVPDAAALLDRLCAAGLAGIEVDTPSHEPEIAQQWRETARIREMVPLGCSDFHGSRKAQDLGAYTTALRVVEYLREHGRTGWREDRAW